jgi:hypothetical protein
MTTEYEKDCLDAAVDLARQRADRLMHRESTDFVGRMQEALCNAEEALDEAGDERPLPVEIAMQYVEALSELAALALSEVATVALQSGPVPASDPEWEQG